MKIEMQIEDRKGRIVPQMRSNRASQQVVREIYMCPSNEGSDDDQTASLVVDSVSFAVKMAD